MAVIRSGSRRSPEKRSVANAVVRGGASVDLVIDVADYRAELVRHRAVIPYGDTITAAQPSPSFDAMQGRPNCGRVMPRIRLTSFGGFPGFPQMMRAMKFYIRRIRVDTT